MMAIPDAHGIVCRLSERSALATPDVGSTERQVQKQGLERGWLSLRETYDRRDAERRLQAEANRSTTLARKRQSEAPNTALQLAEQKARLDRVVADNAKRAAAFDLSLARGSGRAPSPPPPSASEEEEAQDEEGSGAIDMLTSSDDEAAVGAQPAVHDEPMQGADEEDEEGSGPVDLLSSSDDDAGTAAAAAEVETEPDTESAAESEESIDLDNVQRCAC